MDKQNLVLSAHSLQAFVDCERRFELNYLEQLKWPAVESEPVLRYEQFMADGRLFHQMIERDLLGIEVPIPVLDHESDMGIWWSNYQTYRPGDVPGRRFPEKTLVGTIGDHPLTATYDLITVSEDGQATIFDWKTWRKEPDENLLRVRLQTRVYPFLLAQVGEALTGVSISPDDIEMVYWYAAHPEKRIAFSYDATQYLEDLAYLQELVERIDSTNSGDFQLTPDEKKCTLCVFRSYCERGETAGLFVPDEIDESEEDFSLLGSLDDYESIAF